MCDTCKYVKTHKNVTLSLPKTLLQRFRVYAAEKKQSMTALMAEAIQALMDQGKRGSGAKRRFLERIQHAPRGIAAIARTANRDVIAARVHHHAEPPLDQRQILPIGAHQRGSRAIVVEVDDELRFGRNLHGGAAVGNEPG